MRGKAHQGREKPTKGPNPRLHAIRVFRSRPLEVPASHARLISAPAHGTTLAKRAKDDYLSPMLFGIALGGTELLIILAIALVIFGPKKLPELGSGIGKMLRGFKKEMRTLEEENADTSAAPAGEIDVTPAASGTKDSP